MGITMEIDKKIKIGKREYELIDILMFFGLILVGFVIRGCLMKYQSGDWQTFLGPWTNQLKLNGFKSLAVAYYDYTPTYMYVLWFLTKLPFDTMFLLKGVSILFDLLLAVTTAKVVLEVKPGMNPLLPFGIVWLAPTIITNSAMWGQCDSIYVSFIMLCLLQILRGKSGKAMFFYSIATALKLQSAFFAPILVLLFFIKKIRFRDFFWIPITYLISIIPAWIAGRPFKELLTIYYWQSQGSSNTLSIIYPNIYYIIGENEFVDMYGSAGIMFAMGVLLVFMYYVLKKVLKLGLSKEILIQTTLIAGSIVVLLLPRMRERYSYMVDVFAIVYAFVYVKKMYVALVRLTVSYLAYTTYLRQVHFTSYEILAVLLIVLLIDHVYTIWHTFKEEERIGTNEISSV